MEMTCNVQFTVNREGNCASLGRFKLIVCLWKLCGMSQQLHMLHSYIPVFFFYFFFDSAAQVLKVEQGEKYPPFVLDSVFQISDDEGRG